MNNQQVQSHAKQKFSVAIQQDGYKKLINNTLSDPKRVARFIASISSAVAANPSLQECDPGTILSAALTGESLNLDSNPQLGDYFMVPYVDRKNNRTVAQFQLGYKGYIQLAIRSGQYKKLNVFAVKEGEIKKPYSPIDETIEIELLQGTDRIRAKTIGYCAILELSSGFRKMLYWTREEMEDHAMKYSKGYQAKKGYTFWEKDFDGMAFKTMLRQLLSKWGVRSTDLQKAYISDMAEIDETGDVSYIDNTPEFNNKTEELLCKISSSEAAKESGINGSVV